MFHSWTTVAVCGLALGVGVVAVGCDKKVENAGTPAAGGSHASVGVVDPERMITALGWRTEQQKQKDAVVADVKREAETFIADVNKAVEEERKRIITAAKLTTEEADKLAKGQELDKLRISKEQRDEYVRVLQQAYQFLQQAQEYANRAVNAWDQETAKMYTDAAKPAVRRAAEAKGVSVVFLSGAVFHSDPSVDITDKVIDELQKAPPQRNFPATPKLNFKPVRLDDITNPTTKPIAAPVGPSTAPSR